MTVLTSVGAYEETPISKYLAEQADLTAVERFAQRHDAGALPAQYARYRDLLPAAPPRTGQQYAFEVDLDACTGCKACVSACHSLNGLDEDESWRAVTTLRGAPDNPLQQTVTAACHHCVDPACLAGCPVDAYDKDRVTGIVSHLDDQCIGCSYCTLTCPYEVPRFNDRLGIVRKCDMCSDRLAADEAPACVQGCPNEAIRITVVDVAAAIVAAADTRLVPGAPPSRITKPTTVYRGTRVERFAPSNSGGPRPDHPSSMAGNAARAHAPLVVMLVLTQVAVGTFGLSLLRGLSPLVGLVTAAVAFGASILHLGRPRYAYRAWIGLRHSWLSREIVTFGGFMGAGTLYAATRSPLVGALALLAGLAGVFSSVMVYVVTRRPSWRLSLTAPTFAATTVIGGLAVGNVVLREHDLAAVVAMGVAATLIARTALLHRLAPRAAWASALAAAASAVLAVTTAGGVPAVALALLAAAGVVVTELAQRALYFTTATPPR